MTEKSFDLIVIGGGPGGYVAAIRASQLGMRTALVEREHLGGVCLNWGCIPTKALLHAADIRHLLQNAGEFGLRAGAVEFDLKKVVARSRKVAKRLNAGVKHLLKKNAVEVFAGHGRLAGEGLVTVEGDADGNAALRAPHVILSTGARARSLPGLEADGRLVWTYREAMVPDTMPRSALVIGSGAIGIEFASFYRDMGAEITVVEILPRILPAEDAEIAGLARKSIDKRATEIHTDATVEALDRGANGVTATLKLSGGETRSLAVDRVISAVGIVGNTEDLGLEGTAVRVEEGHVAVNEWLETAERGVYAIGDLAGPPWLAHKASHEAVVCVEKIAGLEGGHPMDASRIPGCTYSRPQVASVGLTEEAARVGGHEVKVGRFPFLANGKAIALGETDGLVKTVFDARTGELLGAHLFGADATELIQGYAIARTLETTEAELMRTIFPHPTLSEAMHESVLDAYDRAIHI
jgi:dihydrolipoamide dehydrogenase